MAEDKRTDVAVEVHPEFQGNSLERYMNPKDSAYRYVISAGIARNEAESQSLYNMDWETYLSKAARQCLYDADGELKVLLDGGQVKADDGVAIGKAYARLLATKEAKKERTMSPEAKAKAAAARAERKAKVSKFDALAEMLGFTAEQMASMSESEIKAAVQKRLKK